MLVSGRRAMISRCGQTRAGGGGGGLWLITYRESATNAQVCGPEQGERREFVLSREIAGEAHLHFGLLS